MLGLNEIREKFLSFFEEKDHLRMKSFPLVPQNDKSLLLINSGMAPLKPYFTGQEIPPKKRVATCQKCIRTGDIENVGKTTRHGTFFEMLGNFSFGDYFKEEIIEWSWEFVTEVMQIPKDRLYVSVYLEDDEAFNIWHEKIGLPKERIFKMGKEDNFWEVGIGPCGPCSEIYYDKGEQYGCDNENCTVGCNCDRYMEFWNLVFTQFDKTEDGQYKELSQKNIDTGMGLERMASLMQDVPSIFDVDTVKAIRDEVCKIGKVEYGKDIQADVCIRVITDHIRSLVFMTADGVLPSSDGRGYIFRRLLRRALRHGNILNIKGCFLANLSKVVIETSKDAYPELLEKSDYIYKIISIEEKKFLENVQQAIGIFKNHVGKLKEGAEGVNWGKEAFRLYDTFGLPFDLMQELFALEGITVDEAAFNEEMEKQRQRARSARDEATYMGSEATIYHNIDTKEIGATEFFGYNALEVLDAKVLAIILKNESGSELINELTYETAADGEVSIILDKTPFYAERGGQKGDKGTISTQTATIEIDECILVAGNRVAHIGKITEGTLKVGDTVKTQVSEKERLSICRNHTATHLLQKALRDSFGNHIEQAGSSVDGNKLRFDFTNFAPLSRKEIENIEDVVNEKILECLPVTVTEESIEDARKMGAMALFGEKYSDKVRVVNISDYSIELCGGTHVDNTCKIGSFNIISETGIAAGVRRIEAVTGRGALEYYKDMEEKLWAVADAIKTFPNDVVQKMQYYIKESAELNSEIEKLKAKMAKNLVDEFMQAKEEIGDINVICAVMDMANVDMLRNMGDKLKDKLISGVVVLSSIDNDKVNLVAMATDDVVKKGIHAGNIIKEASAIIGGKGGGRPSMAQAGGKDVDKIELALEKAKEVIRKSLIR